jgi:hypothetical protein
MSLAELCRLASCSVVWYLTRTGTMCLGLLSVVRGSLAWISRC